MLGDGLEGNDLWFLARLLDLPHDHLNRFSPEFRETCYQMPERVSDSARVVILSEAKSLSTLSALPQALAYRWLFGFDPLKAKNRMYR
jgi:hypothetical protein